MPRPMRAKSLRAAMAADDKMLASWPGESTPKARRENFDQLAADIARETGDEEVDEIPGALAAPSWQQQRLPGAKLTSMDAATRADAEMRDGEGVTDLQDLARRQYSKRRRRASIDIAASEEQLKMREQKLNKDPSAHFDVVDPIAEMSNTAAASAAFEAAGAAKSSKWTRSWSLLSAMRRELVHEEEQMEELKELDPLALAPPACIDGVIHPLSALRRRWDMFLFALLTYCAIIIPYRVGFEIVASGFWLVVETAIDCFFIIDIFVRFRMGYTIDSEHLDSRIEMRPKEIAIGYMKSWFVIDVVSGFPTQLLTLLFVEEQEQNANTAATRLPRLLRIPRLVRMMRMMNLLRVMRFFRSDTSGVLKKLVASVGLPVRFSIQESSFPTEEC